jgi:hypothetical protein
VSSSPKPETLTRRFATFSHRSQVDTEINVQLGELTVSKQHVRPLPCDVFDTADFKALFGTRAATFGMRCNVVERATHRTWYHPRTKTKHVWKQPWFRRS